MEKVRILFLQNQLVCGGAEQALFDLISLINREKFDITVLAQLAGGQWYEKFCDTGVKVITPWSCQKESRNPFRLLYNKILGCFIEYAIEGGGKNVIPLCTSQKYDLIVSYSIWDYPYCGFVPGAKSIKVIHGDLETNANYRSSILNYMDAMKRFDRVICVSDGARKSFCRETGITEGVVTHYNPLNSDRVRKMAQEPVDFFSRRKVICAVGRLGSEKGFDRLIRIHKHLLEEDAEHDLVIVGEGPERQNLQQLISELGVEKSVTLAGYSDNPYPYMKMSQLLVCSSYTEGLPVVSMEALCLGIPVISAVPSIGEIFGDQQCGLITENDDDSLQAGLKKALTDPAFYQTLKDGAEKRSAYFEGSRMIRELEEEYLSLLQKK